jgi:hypothetical protein
MPPPRPATPGRRKGPQLTTNDQQLTRARVGTGGSSHRRPHGQAGCMPARAPAARVPGRVHLEDISKGVPPARGRAGVQDSRRTDERRAQHKRIAVHSQHCHAAHSTSVTCTESTGQLLYPRCSARRDGTRAQSHECAGAFSRPPDNVQDAAATRGGAARGQTREPRECCTPACGHLDVGEPRPFHLSTHRVKFLVDVVKY